MHARRAAFQRWHFSAVQSPARLGSRDRRCIYISEQHKLAVEYCSLGPGPISNVRAHAALGRDGLGQIAIVGELEAEDGEAGNGRQKGEALRRAQKAERTSRQTLARGDFAQDRCTHEADDDEVRHAFGGADEPKRPGWKAAARRLQRVQRPPHDRLRDEAQNAGGQRGLLLWARGGTLNHGSAGRRCLESGAQRSHPQRAAGRDAKRCLCDVGEGCEEEDEVAWSRHKEHEHCRECLPVASEKGFGTAGALCTRERSQETMVPVWFSRDRCLCVLPGWQMNVNVNGMVSRAAKRSLRSSMEVTCPDGVGVGDVVAITAPDGREYHVAVPEGVHPGDTFIADIAAPPDETADVDEVNVDAGGAASEEPPHEGEEPWPAPAPVTIAEARGPMDSRELVLALVEHAQKVLENEMQPFLEAKVHLFDQAMEELMSGHGETLEQYAAFKDYERELERHFDTFVAERGFASAAECFAAIDGACVADLARRTREMDELQRKLREALRLQMQGAEDDPDGPGGVAGPMVGMPGAFLMVLGGGDGGERGGVGRSGGEGSSTADAEAEETVPLLLFSQPISLKDMIEHALNLGEYTTFSGIMRMKAKQVRARPCRAGRHGVVHTRGVWARDGAPDRDVCAAVGSAPLWGVRRCGECAAVGSVLLRGCAAVGSAPLWGVCC